MFLLCFVFCVSVFWPLSGEVCVLCFVFWPLLEELYLVENVTHCVFALKARRRRQFWGERWTQHIDLAELQFFSSRIFFGVRKGHSYGIKVEAVFLPHPTI